MSIQSAYEIRWKRFPTQTRHSSPFLLGREAPPQTRAARPSLSGGRAPLPDKAQPTPSLPAALLLMLQAQRATPTAHPLPACSLTVEAASSARDALAKRLYDRTFSYLVIEINAVLAPAAAQSAPRQIGLLTVDCLLLTPGCLLLTADCLLVTTR